MTSGDGASPRPCRCGRPLPADAPRQRQLCDTCLPPERAEYYRTRSRRAGDRKADKGKRGSRTIAVRHLTKKVLAAGAALYPEPSEPLPETRADCRDGARPCPMVRCCWNLYLDVDQKRGSIQFNFPDLEVEDMNESCALDIAEAGGATLEEVAVLLNLTRERVRQIEVTALAKVKDEASDLVEHVDEGPGGRRRLPLLPVVDEDNEADDQEGDDG